MTMLKSYKNTHMTYLYFFVRNTVHNPNSEEKDTSLLFCMKMMQILYVTNHYFFEKIFICTYIAIKTIQIIYFA